MLIKTDGAKNKNGTGFGWVITDSDGVVINKNSGSGKEISDFFEIAPIDTNNRAELAALLDVLCRDGWDKVRPCVIVVQSDSQYVIGCFSGNKVKANIDLIDEIDACMDHLEELGFSIEFEWLPRSKNTAADKLAKDASA